tara:strand:+ start:29006 stop:29881 length:876 start_codon:yes stop_codon:yes gene_type:complete
MSTGIGGSKRESVDFNSEKQIGLFEAKVVAVNPTIEQFKDVLGIELKEDSKQTDYMMKRDGVDILRVDFWLQDVKSDFRHKVSFFLENATRENKDGTKSQYINNIGTCSWADDEENLPEWFVKREYRQAYKGEEDFYSFLRSWLCNLDYKSADSTLQIDWKKLMKGNVKDLKDQIGGEFAGTLGAMAIVSVKVKDGESKEYQGIYSGGFVPAYSLKNFKSIDYGKDSVLSLLKEKESKKEEKLKPFEKFVLEVDGEYGCKDTYSFKELHPYVAGDHLVGTEDAISEEDSDY